MSKSVGDALNDGYYDAFKTMLGGYNDTAATAGVTGRNLSDALMNVNTGYTNAINAATALGNGYSSTGAQRVADFTNLGKSYGETGNLRVGNLQDQALGYQNYSNQANTNADSLMKAGSGRIDDWLRIGTGLGSQAEDYANYAKQFRDSLTSNQNERQQLLSSIPQLYANALGPISPFVTDFLSMMQQDHWNSKKQDTAVWG
jgi:hypothetical protein